MNSTQLKKALTIALKHGKMNTLILGSPGIGKSEIITDICRELGFDLMVEIACTSDPVDLKGLPAVDKHGGAQFIPYGNLKRMIEADKPLVVFYDDLGWAPPSVINGVCHLIQAREINGVKISDHVRFVAASNRRGDNSNVVGLSKALTSRFAGIFTFDCDAESWLNNFGIPKNLPPVLLSFIKAFPAKLCDFDPKEKEIQAFACPRSIYALSHWVSQGIIDIEIVSGVVGPKFALDFIAYYKTYEDLKGLIPDILANPKTAKLFVNKPDTQFALISILANKAKEENIGNIFIYLQRIEQEFAAFAVKLIVTKWPKLTETVSFIEWSLKNQNIVV